VNLDTRVKLAVYSRFAETGRRPLPKDVVGRVDSDVESVLGTYQRLRAQRVLVLEADGSSIRIWRLRFQAYHTAYRGSRRH
jgi:hypothetical protein